jgi:hypothetical protein
MILVWCLSGVYGPASQEARLDGGRVGGGGGEGLYLLLWCATHFLSWPPLISSMFSWERRSGSIVAGVYVAAALGILSLVGGGRREFCDIVGKLGSRDGCAGRGAQRRAGLF